MILQEQIRQLPPSYFSLVMATGIIGVFFTLAEWPTMAELFLILNACFFAVLLIILVYRTINFSTTVLTDFHSYERGPGFLTLVAACCIIGNQFILVNQYFFLAKILLIIAACLWLFIGYGLYFNLTVTDHKKTLKEGINGGWLLFVVAIQSISVLGTLLAQGNHVLLFISLCFFFFGAVFYLYIMSLIIYRMSFFDLHADELGAPYWINMGATAITALAGSMLMLFAHDFPLIKEISPFLKGLTLLFWAAGSWWIPLLVLLGCWRHISKKIKVPLSADGYDPSYWSMVFPLGMYSVSTFRLAEALNLPFLMVIPKYFIFLALFAWCAVMIGLIRNLYSHLKSSS